MYDETAKRIVDSVLDGFNGTVFAYGRSRLVSSVRNSAKHFNRQFLSELCTPRPNGNGQVFLHAVSDLGPDYLSEL